MIFDFNFEKLDDGTQKLNIFSDAWKGLFRKNNDIDSLTEQFNNLQSFMKQGGTLDAANKKLGQLDDVVINFAKNNNVAKVSSDDFRASLNAQTASAKAATVATKALNAALSAGVMLAVSLAISAVVKKLDELIVTTEEQQQKVDGLKSSYDSLNSEFETLSSKQVLTDSEKERLDYLEERLELDKQILEIETRLLYQKQLGTGSWWNKFLANFDSNSLKSKLSKEFGYEYENFYDMMIAFAPGGGLVSASKNMDAVFNGYEATIKKGQELIHKVEGLRNIQEFSLEHPEFTKDIENYYGGNLEEVELEVKKFYDELILKQSYYFKELENAQTMIDSNYLYGEELQVATKQRDMWQEAYDNIILQREEIEKILGLYNDFESLSIEQQRSSLLSRLLQENIPENYAKSIVDAISDSDLSKYWDKPLPLLDIKGFKSEVIKELKELEQGGSVNLTLRPQIDTSELNAKGWDVGEGTAYTSTYSNEDGTIVANFTPIIADPETGEYLGVLSPEELQDYVSEVLSGIREDDLNLQIGGVFEGENAVSQATNAAERINKLHKELLSGNISAEEYVKAYAEAWLNGAQSEFEKEEVDLLSITDTVNNINKKLKPALDSLVNTYTTLFSEEGYEWQPINVEEFASIKEQLDSLSKDFGVNVPTEDYEKFVKVLSDTATTEEQAQQAFNDLASSMINNSNVVQLTDENFNVLKNSLKNLGVTNAVEVLEELKKIKDEVALSGYDLANMTNEEIQKFLEEQKASEETTQYLIAHLIQKNQLNEKPLDTYNDIVALEKECGALKATGELYAKIAQLKSSYYALERNLASSNVLLPQIEKTKAEIDDMFNNKYQYQFEFDYDGNTAKDKSSSKDTKETIDHIATLISRIQRNITNLGKVVSATYRNWSTRNNALAQEMGEVNKEISAQMTAYNAYMAKANSIPLAESYKELIRNGAYKIEDITDEVLKKQIDDFREYYEKALDASDAIEDLRANLAELAMTKFNNVSEQYDEQISLITHNVSMLEGFVSQSEAAGYMASEVYYKAMAEKQQENIVQLQGEYSSLLSAFDDAVKNGSIQKYSSDWYEMLSAINDVELEIQSATTELVEFNQTLQQLSWESFDRVQGYVSNIVLESEHLVDILDAYDLHTDKGIITEEGLAVQGLHAVNYNTYMEQALAYADEMAKIEEEMAKDPYDMELVDRRNELLGLQQEAIQNAMSEKEAIRELVSDGYDKMLNSLDELINKRKEALQAEKDMYDYQNNISEKTNNIANLKKQLQAYSGDNSESAKATIQKLQLSLSEAEKDLQQTEYEKYLSDQEQMLDTLYDQTEEWVNQRLDNLDGLVAEAVDATNKNAETISNAIHDAANSYGYKLSDQMEIIWDYEENAIDGVVTVVSVYGDILKDSNDSISNNITTGTTNVVTAINGLNGSMQTMIGKLNEIATANKNSIAQAQNAVANNQNNYYPTNNSASDRTITGDDKPSNDTPKDNPKEEETKTPKGYYAYIGDEQIGNKYGYANEGMARYAASVEVERRAKAASSGISGSPGVQIYNGTKSSLTRSIKAVPFYAKGTSNAPKGLGVFGEDGREILIANDGSILLSSGATLYPFQGGEQVIDAKETAETLSNKLVPLSINDFNKVSPNMNGIVRNTGGNVENDIQLNIAVKADNFDEFCSSFKAAIKTDPQCRKLLQAVTIDETVGRGGLKRNNF